ncbi:hypothetical protein NFJ02_40g106210 [Pycnococcus provasolii]
MSASSTIGRVGGLGSSSVSSQDAPEKDAPEKDATQDLVTPQARIAQLEAQLEAASRKLAAKLEGPESHESQGASLASHSALTLTQRDLELSQKAPHAVVNYDKFSQLSLDDSSDDDIDAKQKPPKTSYEHLKWYYIAGAPSDDPKKAKEFDLKKVKKTGPFELHEMKQLYDTGVICNATPCYLHGGNMKRFQKLETIWDLRAILKDAKANMSAEERVKDMISAPKETQKPEEKFLKHVDKKKKDAQPWHAYVIVCFLFFVLTAVVFLQAVRRRFVSLAEDEGGGGGIGGGGGDDAQAREL